MSQHDSEQKQTSIDIISHCLQNEDVIDSTKVNISKLSEHCSKYGLQEMYPLDLAEALQHLKKSYDLHKGLEEASHAMKRFASTDNVSSTISQAKHISRLRSQSLS